MRLSSKWSGSLLTPERVTWLQICPDWVCLVFDTIDAKDLDEKDLDAIASFPVKWSFEVRGWSSLKAQTTHICQDQARPPLAAVVPPVLLRYLHEISKHMVSIWAVCERYQDLMASIRRKMLQSAHGKGNLTHAKPIYDELMAR